MPHGIQGKVITIAAAGSLPISFSLSHCHSLLSSPFPSPFSLSLSLSVSMGLGNSKLKCRESGYFEATEERLHGDYRKERRQWRSHRPLHFSTSESP